MGQGQDRSSASALVGATRVKAASAANNPADRSEFAAKAAPANTNPHGGFGVCLNPQEQV